MDWWTVVVKLSGAAIKLALALWFKAGCVKGKVKPATVRLSKGILEKFDLRDRKTVKRATDELVTAGLISVKGQAGRRPLITILPAPKKTEADDDHE
jgi:hypothetical protein